jgi:2-polyprenyl-3-methyl-5-hydroxy-6-metoxy-1,4-benzoquinol methylase
MGVSERLSLESVSEHTVIACEHIHRYDFAAELCRGTRVLDLACGSGYGTSILAETAASAHGIDNDVATVDLAAATVGERSTATFAAADALDTLERDLSDSYDAIVCFEALEHFDGLERAVRGLRDQARRGVRLVMSVPNSRAFEEDNEFHVTDFGYEQALALAEEFDGATMIGQYLTEGSAIVVAGADGVDSRLVNLEQAEPEYANHFLLVVNVDEERITAANRARTQLMDAPVHNRYMRSLEVANQELLRRNNELARRALAHGVVSARAGSAAPSFVAKLNGRIEELELRVQELETQNARHEGDIAFREEMILAQRRELLEARKAALTAAVSSGRAGRPSPPR